MRTCGFLLGVALAGFGSAGNLFAAEIGSDIVQSMDEARFEEEGLSGRDEYLERHYSAEEPLIVRTPERTIVDTIIVPKESEPEPFHSTNLSDNEVPAE